MIKQRKILSKPSRRKRTFSKSSSSINKATMMHLHSVTSSKISDRPIVNRLTLERSLRTVHMLKDTKTMLLKLMNLALSHPSSPNNKPK